MFILAPACTRQSAGCPRAGSSSPCTDAWERASSRVVRESPAPSIPTRTPRRTVPGWWAGGSRPGSARVTTDGDPDRPEEEAPHRSATPGAEHHHGCVLREVEQQGAGIVGSEHLAHLEVRRPGGHSRTGDTQVFLTLTDQRVPQVVVENRWTPPLRTERGMAWARVSARRSATAWSTAQSSAWPADFEPSTPRTMPPACAWVMASVECSPGDSSAPTLRAEERRGQRRWTTGKGPRSSGTRLPRGTCPGPAAQLVWDARPQIGALRSCPRPS